MNVFLGRTNITETRGTQQHKHTQTNQPNTYSLGLPLQMKNNSSQQTTGVLGDMAVLATNPAGPPVALQH